LPAEQDKEKRADHHLTGEKLVWGKEIDEPEGEKSTVVQPEKHVVKRNTAK